MTFRAEIQIHINGQTIEAFFADSLLPYQTRIDGLERALAMVRAANNSLIDERDNLKRSLNGPGELYIRVKESVEKLHERLEEGPKKNVAGYVMSLFAIAEQEAGPSSQEQNQAKKAANSERGKKAWATRQAREAKLKEEANGESA